MPGDIIFGGHAGIAECLVLGGLEIGTEAFKGDKTLEVDVRTVQKDAFGGFIEQGQGLGAVRPLGGRPYLGTVLCGQPTAFPDSLVDNINGFHSGCDTTGGLFEFAGYLFPEIVLRAVGQCQQVDVDITGEPEQEITATVPVTGKFKNTELAVDGDGGCLVQLLSLKAACERTGAFTDITERDVELAGLLGMIQITVQLLYKTVFDPEHELIAVIHHLSNLGRVGVILRIDN